MAAAEAIAADPGLHAEVKAALPYLRHAATALAGPEGVVRALAPLLSIYHHPVQSEAESKVWWSGYFAACADLSDAAVQAGAQAWLLSPGSQYLPKPGELRAISLKTQTQAGLAYNRARHAAEMAPAAARTRAPPTPEQRAEAAKVAAQLRSTIHATPKPWPAAPSTAGKADAGGITRAMRELMAKRAQS